LSSCLNQGDSKVTFSVFKSRCHL